MDFKKQKLVRFYSNGKQNIEHSWEKDLAENLENPSTLYKVSAPLLKPEGGIGEKNRPTGGLKFAGSRVFAETSEPWRERILDPGSELVLQWNRIFLFSCLVALFVDPLFFYLPSVLNDGNSSCMTTDLNLGIVVTCFRTVADIFYLLHVVIKFRTAYVSPSSRVFGRGELVMDPKMIARRYLKSDFFIDAIATLPLPQIVIWFIIPAIRSSHADHTNNALVLIVLLQYIPRFYLIFPLSSQIIKTTGVVTKTAWAGAAYNLLLYMLASHILGASWYLLSIERHATCWKSACRHEFIPIKCSLRFLDCGTLNYESRKTWANTTSVFSNCNPANTISFNYGIFQNAVTNNVVSSEFVEKYFYCLWWGLQNLSSYGQTLSTSTFIGETAFAILIAIFGLVLFAHLIGNMQTYLQSITVRLEEWRLKRRDTEEWMRHRQLPQDLQERVRRFVQYKWLATRGVDEESILRALPTDLRRDIQRHLCLDLVRRVPFFSQMDDQLLDAICERLVSSLSTQGTYLVREGDPVTEMLFIIRGRLESCTTNGGRTGFFNSITLRPGDFCGEELLAWALLPKSSVNLPSSTRTVRALVEVEAFALLAEDLKFVANQFRRLHSKKLQHTFRFYSHHWRTWAACFIQAAWRRYKRRMMAKNLSMTESFSLSLDEQLTDESEQEEEEEEANTPSKNSSQAKQNLGVTILASRFAANTRRGAQKIKDVELPKLQKPEEPDFSAEADDD
ncbi:probable cyclic nucleotide-gated ion channel 14 [Actinidia eriantha]|uniref:probable cyclic nucleotide-gated ion channel 14 n=1 Tax=Actinidia eriantha TaxID=165200 RepID=UPI002584FDBB|nr:probable cyclic nucleotide-gated ion channel 14 [Actinidia eriantha]